MSTQRVILRTAAKVVVLFHILMPMLIRAQMWDVTATGGDYLENGIASVSFTLGEPVGETTGDRFYFLSQGYQQVEWLVSMVWNHTHAQYNAVFFPNPFQNDVELRIDGDFVDENYYMRVYSLSGTLIKEMPVFPGQQRLYLNHFPAATYLIQLLDENRLMLSTHRLIKTR